MWGILKQLSAVYELAELRKEHARVLEQRNQLLKELDTLSAEMQRMSESIEMVLMMRGVG